MENIENNETVVKEETTAKKTNKSSKIDAATIAKKDEEINSLKNEIDELKKMFAEMAAMRGVQAAPQPVSVVTPSTDVVLVYCSDSLGHLATAHVELDFTRWGEEFTLTRSQFDEVVGKYRDWFDQGILAVSGDTEEGIKIAASKGVKTHKEYYLNAEKLERIGKMSTNEIESLWENTTVLQHRESIITFVKRKFIENDPAYRNREKIDLFNRLTDGAFTREQDELSGRIKIAPKNFTKL